MSNESNQVICKVCGELKTRICVGVYASNNRKYQDESGGLWNGKVCSSCHRNKVKDSMNKLRELRKQAAEVQG